METKRFKTNIKCTGCIATVTPYFNEAFGENNWDVDISNPEKILTVTHHCDEDEISKVVSKAGYKSEKI